MPNIKNDPIVKRILYEVAKYYAVSEVDILKAKRGRASSPERVAIYLIRKMTTFSLEEVGKLLGRRAITIISALRTMEEACAANEETAKEIKDIAKNLF